MEYEYDSVHLKNKTKFKVNDLIRITGNQNSHQFDRGDIVRVVANNASRGSRWEMYRCLHNESKEEWNVVGEDAVIHESSPKYYEPKF